jgi:hypothetical protein
MINAKAARSIVWSSVLLGVALGCASADDSGTDGIASIRLDLSAPQAPVITSPAVDGEFVNGADVHMETAPFQDPDPGQQHFCTDWEIWTAGLGERVWFAGCVDDTLRVHAHLGDGDFEGSLAGESELLADTDYVLRARHRDDSGDPATEWSPYAERSFHTRADVPPIPGAPNWCILQPGYRIEEFSSGFSLPVNIAFIPNATGSPTEPLFYVTELYGTIKVVFGDGSFQDYETDLLNFNPTGEFPGSGEKGVTGIAVEPITGDVFVSLLYEAVGGEDPIHYPKVLRLHSTDGGRTASSQTTVIDMVGERQRESHQISNLSIGPDGKLYVHMGDGFEPNTAQDQHSFRGKILRMNLDGTAPSDNFFFNASDGITARDYTYALGFRNPFGGAWRSSDAAHYEVENGNSIDRLARVTAGTNYNWAGSDDAMDDFALYNWEPPHAPVNIDFIQESSFHFSGYPEDKADHAFVSESGPTFDDGPKDNGKAISEFVIAPGGGALLEGPIPFVKYNGLGHSTVAALAAGPDGLYFSELYSEFDDNPTAPFARIFRVRYTGIDETGPCIPPEPPAPVEVVPVTQLLKRNSPNLCIDVPGGTEALGTQLQIRTCNRRPEQTWLVNPKGNDEYEIRRAGTNLCVDVLNGDPFPGQLVTQFDCNDTAAQRFNVEPLTGGAQIRNINTNQCVSVVGGANSSFARLELRDCNGSDAQAFHMDVPSLPPINQFTKKESPDMCIDVRDGSMAALARIQLWGCNHTNAQLFRLVNKAPGQFEIRRGGTNLCIDTPGGASLHQPLVQSTCNSSAGQRFHAEPLPGGVQLRRVGTNLCADVVNNSNDFGVDINLFTCNGTAAQIFALDTPTTQLQKQGSNLCIEVPGATHDPGVQLDAKTCSRTEQQTWEILAKTHDEYEIRRAGTDLCIDVLNGEAFPGQVVTQFFCNDTQAQRFHVEPAGSGARIRNAGTNLCLDIDGTKLELGNCGSSSGETFLFDPESSPPLHQLAKKDAENMCIDVPNADFTPGIQLQIFDCNRTNAQLFQLLQKTTGQFEVRRAGTNLCFGTPGGSAFAGQSLVQTTCNNTTSQRFHSEPMPGGVQLRRVGTNLCADVTNNSNDAGSPLVLFTCNGTSAQIFAQE